MKCLWLKGFVDIFCRDLNDLGVNTVILNFKNSDSAVIGKHVVGGGPGVEHHNPSNFAPKRNM